MNANFITPVSASGADTDSAGLISIYRADTDPYRTSCGTTLVFTLSEMGRIIVTLFGTPLLFTASAFVYICRR